MLKRKFKSFRKIVRNIDQFTIMELNKNHTYSELKKIARKESAEYIYSHLSIAILFNSDESYWSYLMTNKPKDGLLLEFGVYLGRSINYMAEQLKKDKDPRTFYGFDSFEGLSEDWGGTSLTRGTFSTSGELPEVLPNVKLIKGWVNDTLLPFLDKIDETDRIISYLHLDMDVYSPTKYVLNNIIPYLKVGSIIDFDDLIGFPGWKQGEFKAMQETLDNICKYEHIAYCELNHLKEPYQGIMKSAIKITDI